MKKILLIIAPFMALVLFTTIPAAEETTSCPPSELSAASGPVPAFSAAAASVQDAGCPKNVGIFGDYFGPSIASFLRRAGHTVTMESAASTESGSLGKLDVLYITRAGVPDAASQSARIESWVRAGGTLITEFDATKLLLDGTFGFFGKAVLDNDFSVPSRHSCGGNTVSILDAGSGLAEGLPASWICSGDPMGVFKVYRSTTLDPALRIVASINADTNKDGVNDPVVGVACVGSGSVVAFFSDFADWQPLLYPRTCDRVYCARSVEDEMLLLNAVCGGASCFIPVGIDIKPGSFPNIINLGSSGCIPVAIFGSESFDAGSVDPATISLSGARVKVAGRTGNLRCRLEDVNGDGIVDLLCQVVTAGLSTQEGEDVAVLSAATYDGKAVRGEDMIKIVPGSNKARLTRF